MNEAYEERVSDEEEEEKEDEEADDDESSSLSLSLSLSPSWSLSQSFLVWFGGLLRKRMEEAMTKTLWI